MSPNTNPLVNDFLVLIKHPLQDGIGLVRQIILSADDRLSEHIKWNAPSYVYNGEDRVTMNLRKPDQIIILFHRGVKKKYTTGFVFDDKSGLLQWLDKDRAMITFSSVSDILDKQDKLKTLVKERIQID